MSLSPTAARIGEINFEGIIIPVSWFQWIKRDDGSPDLLAMAILAEIVYWYRPVVVRDETSGHIIEIRNKFKADKLQKDYADFAQLFGASKKQVRTAIKRLEELGLVTKELRNVQLANGRILPNVLYIEPVAEMVAYITQPRLQHDSSPKRSIPEQDTMSPSREGICVPGGIDTPPPRDTSEALEGNTNTKNTTQSTTQITTRDSSTYVHATACAGAGGEKGEDVQEKPPTNKKVIAELVGEYRKVVPKEVHAPGDYGFIGRLYNNYGYDVVLEAIQELAYKVEAGFTPEKPLLFLKYLITAGAQGGVQHGRTSGKQTSSRRNPKEDEEWLKRMAEYDKLWIS